MQGQTMPSLETLLPWVQASLSFPPAASSSRQLWRCCVEKDVSCQLARYAGMPGWAQGTGAWAVWVYFSTDCNTQCHWILAKQRLHHICRASAHPHCIWVQVASYICSQAGLGVGPADMLGQDSRGNHGLFPLWRHQASGPQIRLHTAAGGALRTEGVDRPGLLAPHARQLSDHGANQAWLQADPGAL